MKALSRTLNPTPINAYSIKNNSNIISKIYYLPGRGGGDEGFVFFRVDIPASVQQRLWRSGTVAVFF
jgi:hypothetical protein